MGLRKVISRGRFIIGLIIGIVLTGSVAYSANIFNTPETGYLLCVNQKTKIITYPATQKCPSGTSKLILGARGAQGTQGIQGEKGEKGDLGPQGIQGITGEMGPQGERGLTGPQGIQGPQGVAGANGTNTTVTATATQKVYDSTGQLLGDYLSLDSNGSATVKRSGTVITYGGSAYSGNAIINGFTYYISNTCTGNKYASLANRSTFTVENPYVSIDLMSGGESGYVFTIGHTPGPQIDTLASSVFAFVNGECVATSTPTGDGAVTKIKMLTILDIPTKASPPYSIR
jgi:hypothetical protein